MQKSTVPWRSRIKERVLMFGIAMSVFPLLFVGLASFNAARLHFEGTVQRENYEKARDLAGKVKEFVKNTAESLNHVTSSGTPELIGNNSEARLTILNSLLRQEQFLEELTVTNSDGVVLGQADRRKAIFPSKAVVQIALERPENGQNFTISEVFSGADGRPEFSVTVPVTDILTGKALGYVQAKIDLKGMITGLSNLQIGQTGYMYLVDEKGKLIADADFGKVLARENVTGNPDVRQFLAVNSQYQQRLSAVTESLNNAGVRSYGNSASQADRTGPTEFFKSKSGVNLMGLYAPVILPNWAVVVEQPVQEAYAPIYQYAWRLLGTVAIAILIVTLLSIYFGLRLTNPIEIFEAKVRHMIATGNLSRVSVPTRDEIGLLADSFNHLTAMLEEKSQNLLAEKEVLSSVVNGIGAGMLLLDEKKQILWWNKVLREWFNEEMLPNRTWDEMVQAEPVQFFSAEGFRVVSLNLQNKRRYIREILYDLPKGNPEKAAYLLLLEDVTLQVEMEAHMIETDKMAAVGLLASGVAHEINNPLAIVSAHIEDLLERFVEELLPAPGEISSNLQIMGKQIERCKQIIQRLLHFSHKRSEQWEIVDVASVTAQTLNLIGYRAKQRNISIECSLVERVYVYGSENEWQQVILNIMSNAIDAAPCGSSIRIASWCSGDRLLLEVKDEGPGIPAEYVRKVFEPFFTTKPAGQGTGLGLYISYWIIHRMEGELKVESEEGRGTKVTINVPIRQNGGDHS